MSEKSHDGGRKDFSPIVTNNLAIGWDKIDAKFSSIIGLVHLRLCFRETKPAEAADTFVILLRAHLECFLD